MSRKKLPATFCSHLRDVVTIDDCWSCRHLCVDNPNLRESAHANADFVNRWGVQEIDNYIERRRNNEMSGKEVYTADEKEIYRKFDEAQRELDKEEQI